MHAQLEDRLKLVGRKGGQQRPSASSSSPRSPTTRSGGRPPPARPSQDRGNVAGGGRPRGFSTGPHPPLASVWEKTAFGFSFIAVVTGPSDAAECRPMIS